MFVSNLFFGDCIVFLNWLRSFSVFLKFLFVFFFKFGNSVRIMECIVGCRDCGLILRKCFFKMLRNGDWIERVVKDRVDDRFGS